MSNHLPSYTPPDNVRKRAEELVADWPALTPAQSALIGTVLGGARD